MRNFLILTESINYIEENLCEPISRADIASHCYVSLSSLEKLFRYALGHSIMEYISRRRMTLAAADISKHKLNVTDAAMKYQYNSVEVFSRAFRRVWNQNPSDFFENKRFTNIFPKINYEYERGDDLFMARKRVDMSEAYDYLKNAHGSYVLCFDGVHFSKFNEISRKAGDMAILEIAARVEKYATDDMLVLRIGGDEFALITGLYDEEKARELASEIVALNGNPIIFEGKELPLSLWCGMTKIPDSLRYSDFFTELHKAIDESKH